MQNFKVSITSVSKTKSVLMKNVFKYFKFDSFIINF